MRDQNSLRVTRSVTTTDSRSTRPSRGQPRPIGGGPRPRSPWTAHPRHSEWHGGGLSRLEGKGRDVDRREVWFAPLWVTPPS